MRKASAGLLLLLCLAVVLLSFGSMVYAESGDPEEQIAIDESHFPHDEFRRYVTGEYDQNSDGYLSKKEREAVREIASDYDKYEDLYCSLDELKLFPNIKRIVEVYLDMSEDEDKLTLTEFPNLEVLSINIIISARINEFHVEYLPKLESFYIGMVYASDYEAYCRREMFLDLLSVDNCPKLKRFDVSEGGVGFDLSLKNCVNLERIESGYIQFDNVELDNLPNLKYIGESGPRLIDIGERVALSKSDIKPENDEYGEFMSRRAASLRYTIVIDANDDENALGWYTFDDGKKAYVNTDRKVAMGIRKIGRELYFFGRTNLLTEDTGWKEFNGNWYYIEKGGVVRTGWVKSNGNWYYLGTDGSMKTGWQRVYGKWYYFRENGIMLHSQYIQGYWLNKDGSCTYKPVASWRRDNTGVYYQDTSGYYVRNTTVIIDRKKYTFDKRGYLVK